jgi:hypothetical protein
MSEKALVNKKYLLEKYPGKGGWTYARIPEIKKDKKAHFGWVKVRGTIDGIEIRKYHLFPIKDSGMFLPVKAEIRKKIKKQEGDYVHVILYPDNEPLDLPEEMLLCLKEEPAALRFFKSLSDAEQKHYIQWIYSAKKEETKIDRMAASINRLLKKQKLHDKNLL